MQVSCCFQTPISDRVEGFVPYNLVDAEWDTEA